MTTYSLSYTEQEQLTRLKATGLYQSTRHNDATKALESLISKGFPIKREVVNKYLIQFTLLK